MHRKINPSALSFLNLRLFCVSLVILLSSCSERSSDLSSLIVRELPGSQILLTYKDENNQDGKINASDVHGRVALSLQKLRDETTALYRREAEELAFTRILEARARAFGFKGSEDFIADRKTKIEVRDAEVLDFIKRNHLAASVNKDEVKNFLKIQAWTEQEAILKQSLLKNANFQWQIAGAHHEFETKAALPKKGQGDAKFVIHEFCDFSNPLCSSIRMGLEQVLARYPNDVSLVLHLLVNPDRPGSLHATRASFCAAEQGKYWQMVNQLFDHQSKLDDEVIQGIAKLITLDLKIFQACLIAEKTQKLLQEEQARAIASGVKDTPALFLDGVKIDSMDALIERVSALVKEKNRISFVDRLAN